MTTKTNLTQPAYNSTSWDAPLNANFGALDNALGGTVAVNVASGDVTLTSGQAQNMRVVVTGALTVARYVYLPSGLTGFWIVSNATSGNYAVTVANASGVGQTVVSQGTSALLYSDGTSVLPASNSPTTGATPPGTIISFGATTAPYGYVSCDGSAISRTDYANLFSAIGTTWGAGNGSSTFNVPDLRGYFLRGYGTNSDGAASGAFATKVADSLASHTHTVTDPGHLHGATAYASASLGGAGTFTFPGTSGSANFNTKTATTGISIGSTGGTETAPKTIAVLYCIKW